MEEISHVFDLMQPSKLLLGRGSVQLGIPTETVGTRVATPDCGRDRNDEPTPAENTRDGKSTRPKSPLPRVSASGITS